MKSCNQKEHVWVELNLPLKRYKCSHCGCYGKIYKKGILPLKGIDTLETSKNRKI